MDKKELNNLLKECGMLLYDTEIVNENGNAIFRVYIISPHEAVTLDKCTEVTKILSPVFDLDPPIDGEYFLEVSSPGIDRKLTTLDHYRYSVGDLVKLKLIDGTKIKAKLLSVQDGKIKIYDKNEKEDKIISFNEISKAKTYFEW